MIKFKIKAGRLSQALTALMPVVPTKSNRETLKNIKIIAEITSEGQERLRLIASDLEIFAQLQFEGNDLQILKDGQVLLPAQALLDFVKSFGSDDTLLCEHLSDSSTLRIECDGSNLELGIQDIDEYPKFPEIPANAEKFEISADNFGRLVSKTEFATADKNSPKIEFTSICINCVDNKISMMATDAHRIAIATSELKAPVKEERQFLVSPRALSQILKMSTTGDIHLLVSNSTLFVIGEAGCVTVQLIDAKFPPVKELIPDYGKKITLRTNEFINQLKKAALATDNKNTVRLKLQKDGIILSAKTREQNKTANVKYVCEFNDQGVETAFDSKYLLDALKAAETQGIEFHFREPDESLFFTEPGFQYILAPQEV